MTLLVGTDWTATWLCCYLVGRFRIKHASKRRVVRRERERRERERERERGRERERESHDEPLHVYVCVMRQMHACKTTEKCARWAGNLMLIRIALHLKVTMATVLVASHSWE